MQYTKAALFFFAVIVAMVSMASADAGIMNIWNRQGLPVVGNPLGQATGGDGSAPSSAAATGPSAAATTTTSHDAKTTSSAAPSTTSTTSSAVSTTSTTAVSTTSSAATSTTTQERTTSQSASLVESTKFVVVHSTVDGNPTTFSSAVTTAVTASPTATLANESSSGSGGISTQTRNIAIGVGVGIGGAILLAGLGVFAWRFWGRKRQPADEDNFLMADTPMEKPSSSGASPFKSTLDQYHNPAGRVNTASNF